MTASEIELAVSSGTFITMFGTSVLAHLKGRKRDRGQVRELREIADRLDAIDTRIHDIFALVIGVDGRNGLRSEVEKNAEAIRDLEFRERDRLERRALSLAPHGGV